jgi:hypothetical protein
MSLSFRRKKSSVFSKEKLTEIENDLSNSLNQPPKKERRLLVTKFYRFNGTGTTVIGRRDFSPDGTHTTTAWFTFLLIPVMSIQSYRVTSFGSTSFTIQEILPLNIKQVAYTYLYTAFCLAWLYGLFSLCYYLGLSARPILPAWMTVLIFIAGIIPPALLPYMLRRFAENKCREN